MIGEHGLLKQLSKVQVERALEAEMEAHLGHAKNEIEIPRDRHASFRT